MTKTVNRTFAIAAAIMTFALGFGVSDIMARRRHRDVASAASASASTPSAIAADPSAAAFDAIYGTAATCSKSCTWPATRDVQLGAPQGGNG